jgi:hypothetical protein
MARVGLMTATVILLIVLVTSFIIALLVGISLLNGSGRPDSFTSNLIAVVVSSVVFVGSLVAIIAIRPYTTGPANFKPSYGQIAPMEADQPFEVRYQRYLWGRSLRGKGTAQFGPQGLTVTGHIEPHALFQVGVVFALTFLPLIFFNFGLGIIPALAIAYYVGRKKFSRTFDYHRLGAPVAKGRRLTLRSDETPRQIDLVVARVDGERLYREVQRYFPAAIGGWQG